MAFPGGARLLADLGHEVPASLLSTLLTSILHAPASALGLIEGIPDAAAGLANLTAGLPGLRERPVRVAGQQPQRVV